MKNLTVYRLSETFNHEEVFNSVAIQSRVARSEFVPLQPSDQSRTGLVPTLYGAFMSKVAGDIGTMFTVRRQEKSIKPFQLNSMIKEKLEEFAQIEGRPAGKKVKERIKEECILTLLPKTFPNQPVDINVIITKNFVYCDAPMNKAEDACSYIREILGEFPLTLIEVPTANLQMSNCITGKRLPEPFTLGGNVRLVDEEGTKVSVSGGSLYGVSVSNLVKEEGYSVIQLGVSYDDIIEFTIKDTTELTGITFSKDFMERGEDDLQTSFYLQLTNIIKAYDIAIHKILCAVKNVGS